MEDCLANRKQSRYIVVYSSEWKDITNDVCYQELVLGSQHFTICMNERKAQLINLMITQK